MQNSLQGYLFSQRQQSQASSREQIITIKRNSTLSLHQKTLCFLLRFVYSYVTPSYERPLERTVLKNCVVTKGIGKAEIATVNTI